VQSTLTILSFYYLLNTPIPEQQRQRLFSRDTTPPLPCKSEGSHCSCHPSLARNARQRGPTALAIPSLARSARRRGYFSFGTSPPLPCTKRKLEGSFSLATRHRPFLARNARQRGPTALATPSLARSARRRGYFFSFSTSPPLPCMKHGSGGSSWGFMRVEYHYLHCTCLYSNSNYIYHDIQAENEK
jgi:hypothetical protein